MSDFTSQSPEKTSHLAPVRAESFIMSADDENTAYFDATIDAGAAHATVFAGSGSEVDVVSGQSDQDPRFSQGFAGDPALANDQALDYFLDHVQRGAAQEREAARELLLSLASAG